MQVNDRIEEALARSNTYKLLSMAFIRELTPEAIGVFRGSDMAETLRELGEGFGREFYNRDEQELLKELAEEYAALFILPGGVNPTESVARAGLYMQTFAGQVTRFYRKCSFTLPDDFRGFPDHIGIELEFMSHLAKNEAGAYRENKADGWVALQKEFLQDHLSRWAADFAGGVAKYTRQPFYREMARLLYEFIRSEAEELMVYQENM